MKNIYRTTHIAGLSLLLLVFLFGFSVQLALGAAAPEEIKIGVICSDTGAFITQGKNLKNGLEMAVAEINAAGGIDGRPIKLVFANDDSNNEKAQSAAKKLIYEDRVLAILGPCGSSTIYAAQQVTEAAKVVLISHVGSSPKLTGEGQKYYFRNSISAAHQTKDLVRYVVEELGCKRIAIAYDPGRTKSDAETFTEDLKAFKLEPVAVVEFMLNDVSFTSQLLKLKSANPDAVMVLGTQQQTAAFARQAQNVGLGARLMGVTVIAYDEYIQLAGKAAEGTLATATFSVALASQNPKVKQFVDKYREKFKEEPEHSAAQAYDAMYVLAQALRGLSLKPGDLAKDRDAIRDNLEKTKNYRGIAGVITYGPNDHDGYEHPNIIEVKDGKWQVVREAE